MSFSDDNPDRGHWCSRQDCLDVFSDLENALQLEQDFLNRCIVSATRYAMSILRSRWATGWPFGSKPPEELREAVATIAVYRAMRRITHVGGAVEITDRLKLDCDDSIKWLNDLAASEVQVELPQTQYTGRLVRCGPPKGEMGFGA